MAQVIGAGALVQSTIDAMLMGDPRLHAKSTDTTIQAGTAGWRLITYGAALAITMKAPILGEDDFKLIQVVSATAFAHTVTLPSALFATGAALNTIATFAAFAGAGFVVRIYNGKFLVISSVGITFS